MIPSDPPPRPGPASAAFEAERFRREGRQVIDWIADYLATLAGRPVQSLVEPGWVRAQLPAHPPEHPEPLSAVLADLDRVIVPGLTHWQHPGFFAFFPAGSGGPSILGELLSAGLGVQGMLWITSPACTELETLALDWLRGLLGLPECFASTAPGGGVIHDSASSGLLSVVVAARERILTRDAASTTPDAAGRLVAYASAAAHSSVEKGIGIAGLGRAALRKIAVDARGSMDATALAAAMADDARAGLVPCFVVATVGTTATGAIDPVPAIAAEARRHGAWLHVDAAWAGAAAVCPELRGPIVAGAEAADSWGFNPHKWLPVNLDCHALWVADRRPLVRALSMKPDYLQNAASESGAVVDYADWQVPLGRRFRALKLWMTLRMLGAEALRGRIRDHVGWAAWFADRVRSDRRFSLLAPPSLSLVCFGLETGDAASAALLDRVNRRGRVCLSSATVGGRLALRLAVGGTLTCQHDVETAWEEVSAAADNPTVRIHFS